MAFGSPYGPVVTMVKLPFSNPIPGGFTNEKQIQIQGIVQNTPAANGFSINICEGPKIEPNCHLHINPRFTQNCIVRNAMIGTCWGAEERQGGLPIQKGKLFEMIIMATPSGYQIAINGRHFTEFKHRLPLKTAKYVFIDGDYMEIKFIQYEGGNTSLPAPAGMVPNFSYPHAHPAAVAGFAPPPYSPSPVPMTQKITGGVYPNKMIYITGIPNPGASRFSINLRTGPGDIAFHFDARFRFGENYNTVVRNTCSGGCWGPEERDANTFPFVENATFNMIIMITSACFKVAVNNVHFISYNHRLPMQRIKTLNITGDVRIVSVSFQ